ncbi:MAG: hypothetical protein EA422_12530 [Gemmatimonadales bacterium]|nr:MAG: hypothetical protein EA422_12530 [Gemmatimonadales bacterium]
MLGVVGLPGAASAAIPLDVAMSTPAVQLETQDPTNPDTPLPDTSRVHRIGHERVLSINPVALVALGLFSMDYEQRLGDDTTWGMSLSYFDWRDRNYLSLDGKFRYYFGGDGLDGMSAGFILGMNRAGRDSEDEDEVSRRSGAAVGLGFVVEQQWLVGSGERFAVTLGGGGKRLFFLRDVGAQRALPTVRLSIGWAF